MGVRKYDLQGLLFECYSLQFPAKGILKFKNSKICKPVTKFFYLESLTGFDKVIVSFRK